MQRTRTLFQVGFVLAAAVAGFRYAMGWSRTSIETYCPATDGVSAARIEEEVVVTKDGCDVITLFPAEELFVANEY